VSLCPLAKEKEAKGEVLKGGSCGTSPLLGIWVMGGLGFCKQYCPIILGEESDLHDRLPLLLNRTTL
jgi:hypothetical protein